LSWVPRTPLRQGLGRTVEYFDRLLKDDTVRVRVVTAA
jgi:hypothetical protein